MTLFSILMIAFFILVAIFLFSLAVFIHEFGHFIAARLLGLRADVFSIGFGPALWKKRIGNTEYRFSMIPFGGYVSLPQLDPEGMRKIQGDHGETYAVASPWRRIVVAIAGPLGNIFLAAVCAALISWFSPRGTTGASTEVGYIEPQSSAEKANLCVGDVIAAVNGNPVHTWQDFQTECYLAGGTNEVVTLEVMRADAQMNLTATLDTQLAEGIYAIGGVMPGPLQLGVGEVMPESPAAKAKLVAGDVIQTVDGKPFTCIEQLTHRENSSAEVVLTVKSSMDVTARTVSLTPSILKAGDPPRMGIVVGFMGQRHFQWMANRGIGAQLWSDASSIFRVLKALTAPKTKGETSRAAKGLGGPLMIFGLFFQVVQTGFWASLGFVRLICVNLAILNLLPLPVLDGGHVLFASYAIVRRKEASPKLIGWLTNVFACVLIGLMLLLVYRDTLRFILG
ncbi:MAG: RIP metalloprotease RseP [Kiritimatiellia bacterium]